MDRNDCGKECLSELALFLSQDRENVGMARAQESLVGNWFQKTFMCSHTGDFLIKSAARLLNIWEKVTEAPCGEGKLGACSCSHVCLFACDCGLWQCFDFMLNCRCPALLPPPCPHATAYSNKSWSCCLLLFLIPFWSCWHFLFPQCSVVINSPPPV